MGIPKVKKLIFFLPFNHLAMRNEKKYGFDELSVRKKRIVKCCSMAMMLITEAVEKGNVSN